MHLSLVGVFIIFFSYRLVHLYLPLTAGHYDFSFFWPQAAQHLIRMHSTPTSIGRYVKVKTIWYSYVKW